MVILVNKNNTGPNIVNDLTFILNTMSAWGARRISSDKRTVDHACYSYFWARYGTGVPSFRHHAVLIFFICIIVFLLQCTFVWFVVHCCDRLCHCRRCVQPVGSAEIMCVILKTYICCASASTAEVVWRVINEWGKSWNLHIYAYWRFCRDTFAQYLSAYSYSM